MTTQDLIDWFANHQNHVLAYFGIVLLLAIVVSAMVNKDTISNLKYVLSALVFAVTVPGILAILLTLYNVLFLGTNLLNVNLVSYLLPVVAMVCTLLVLNRKVKMAQLPGFSKLTSLVVMISIAFIIIFILQRTYFGVLIFGGFAQVLMVFAALMVVLTLAWKKFSK